jgi:phosphatidylglycerol:prolipoprotein diacylglycerol transferase
VPWGIYVDGVLRHPSQLYEAFLEGIVVFVVLFILRKYKSFEGQLAIAYLFLYSLMRALSEIYREPDFHIGYDYANFITRGQIISFLSIGISFVLYFYIKNKYGNKP